MRSNRFWIELATRVRRPRQKAIRLRRNAAFTLSLALTGVCAILWRDDLLYVGFFLFLFVTKLVLVIRYEATDATISKAVKGFNNLLNQHHPNPDELLNQFLNEIESEHRIFQHYYAPFEITPHWIYCKVFSKYFPLRIEDVVKIDLAIDGKGLLTFTDRFGQTLRTTLTTGNTDDNQQVKIFQKFYETFRQLNTKAVFTDPKLLDLALSFDYDQRRWFVPAAQTMT